MATRKTAEKMKKLLMKEYHMKAPMAELFTAAFLQSVEKNLHQLSEHAQRISAEWEKESEVRDVIEEPHDVAE